MKSFFAAVSILLAIVSAPAVMASGKKENKTSISFHMETEATDNPKMIFPQLANGERRFFRRMPDLTSKDVISFRPFPSDIGEDYGVVLRLKENAVHRLSALTSANQGKWLIAQVNGRVVDGVLIDKPVSDGVIVIWKGVTLADIALFDASMPRIGEEDKKKKK